MQAELERTVQFDSGIDSMVAWCRSAEARRNWPGVRDTWGTPDRLLYSVEMHAPGAADGELLVEEHLRPIRSEDGVVWFDSDQWWLWPVGEPANAWASYRFWTADGVNHINFRLRYLTPGSPGARMLNRVRFGSAVQRAASLYFDGLMAHAPVGVPAAEVRSE